MVQLPVELLDRIASFSSSNDLPQLSTISRAWQSVVERRTMRAIQLKSTDLQDFSNVFIHQNRRAALVDLSYSVILPAYNDHQCARFETDRDKQRNNQALTDAIHALLFLLHSWDEEAVGLSGDEMTSYSRPAVAGRISWTLDAYSPTDVHHRQDVNVDAQRFEAQLAGGRKDLFEHRYERSFLRMLNCEGLPAVSRIGGFHVEELCHRRRIEGASLAGIAAKLPNLETIVWAVNDDEKRDALVRQVHRFEFAQSLAMLPAQSLKRVDLNLFNQDPSNQNFNLSSALPMFAPSTDHLSLALHALSQSPKLTHLSLKGDIVLSPCFFWPDDDDNDPSAKAPFWPCLEDLDVYLNITTPSGHWLYVRDPSDSDPEPDPVDEDPLTPTDLLQLDEEENGSTHSSDSDNSEVPDTFNARLQEHLDGTSPSHRFRTMLDGDRLHPMLMAMARAAGRMPAVRRLALHLNPNSLGGIDLECLVGPATAESGQEGHETKTTTPSSSSPQPYKHWQVSIGLEAKWTPPEDLQDAWKKSAGGGPRAKYGADDRAEDDEDEELPIRVEYY